MASSQILRNSPLHRNITSNTDLNDLTAEGIYGCGSGAVAETLQNCPVLTNFVMIVISKNTAYTMVTQILTNAAWMYIRTQSSAGWDSWYKYTGTKI